MFIGFFGAECNEIIILEFVLLMVLKNRCWSRPNWRKENTLHELFSRMKDPGLAASKIGILGVIVKLCEKLIPSLSRG